jgi:GNAT superfamily N-acetyltransferase
MSGEMDETIERSMADFFWVPDDVHTVERPEISYLHSDRDTAMYNQVLRTRAEAGRIPELVAEVLEAHAGRPSRWSVPCTIDREPLEEALAAAGYQSAAEHFAYTIAVEEYEGRSAPGVVVREVDSRETLDDCIEIASRSFDMVWTQTESDLCDQLEACTATNPRVFRSVAYDEATGAPLSSGGMSLFPDLGFAFLWGGCTVPEARGRGAYSAVMKARVRHARSRGLARVGLYAMIETSAPIVERQGFERHGPMVFWERPAS